MIKLPDLTLKKSLVKSKLAAITSYANATAGTVAATTTGRSSPKGCFPSSTTVYQLILMTSRRRVNLRKSLLMDCAV